MASFADIDKLAAKVPTVADARVVLVRAIDDLVEAASVAGDVTTWAGAQDQAFSFIDAALARVQQVQDSLPESGDLSALDRRRVAGAALYARDALSAVSAETGSAFTGFLDELPGAFRDVVSAVSGSTWMIAAPVIAVLLAVVLFKHEG